MIAFLKTKFAPFVMASIPLLSLIFGAYVFHANYKAQQKGLTIELVSVSKLLNDEAKADGKGLRVLFGDDVVKNFAIAQIMITNTGNAPILSADFEDSIKIFISDASRVYFHEIKNMEPPNLRPKVFVMDNGFAVSPLLLNPNDKFVVELGVDLSLRGDTEIFTESRVVGISKIEAKKSIVPIDKIRRNYATVEIDLVVILDVMISLLVILFAFYTYMAIRMRFQKIESDRFRD